MFRKTALVIDDNQQTADSLCQLLSLLDLETSAVYGPRAALHSLANTIPDVVFLDLNMPGVSGFEVLAYLRREPRLMSIPVVIITTDDQKETEHKALQEGALEVIIKPASLEILESTLRNAEVIA